MEASAHPTDREAAVWEATASLQLGLIMCRFLRHYPPPPDDRLGQTLIAFSEELVSRGRACLSAVPAPALRLVPAPAA